MDNQLNPKQEASRKTTSVKRLKELAQHEDKYVRKKIAKNIKTPLALLKKLAKDECMTVRESVANNKNTPAIKRITL